MRGGRKVAEQYLLSAACQNMKKIALVLTRIAAATAATAAKAIKTAAAKAGGSPEGGPGKSPEGGPELIMQPEAVSGCHPKIIWLKRAITWTSLSGVPDLAAA